MKFGTDGVRGLANRDLTVEDAVCLGRAAATVLGGPRIVIGRDTRRSSPMLEAALAAGITSAGVDVVLLGVAPTPAVASVSRRLGMAGAMVSASHNPFADNGIKLFAPGGGKLSDATQAALEAAFVPTESESPVGAAVGTIEAAAPELLEGYLDQLQASLQSRSIDGLHVVIDCANGAAARLGGDVFERAGARVTVIGDAPDGLNINVECGSTHPARLAAAVLEHHADVGFAFDGDADRLIAVSADGVIVDGDELIGISALDRAATGRLAGNAVVVTVMSNLGLRLGMAAAGIELVETPVGDRYVLEALANRSLSLGGEQSGHIIHADLATTGDGMLAALQAADVMTRTGRPLAELAAAAMTRLPQVLHNVVVSRRPDDLADQLDRLDAAAASELGSDGRVLIRASGTEPVIRVMVEALDPSVAEHVAGRLTAEVSALVGPPD